MNGLSYNSLPIYDCRLSIENQYSERSEDSPSAFLRFDPHGVEVRARPQRAQKRAP